MLSRKSRRVLATTALAAAMVTSLAACRVEQGAAIFVGDTRISSSQVDEIVDALPTKPQAPMSIFRSSVVDALTMVELGKQVAEDTGAEPIAAVAETPRQYWTSQGLERDSEFVDLMAQAETYRAMLSEDAEPTKASSKDINEIAERYELNTGEKLNGPNKAGLKQQLNTEEGQALIGQRDQLASYVDEYSVTANPRYGDAYIVVARGENYEPLLTVELEG
ncbi:MAG TPA: hypothetical protein H9902_02825 [Candidatus Stackebrandtia faecavium]|nr:hypothetical protein [Candidatus Stackebrandtia faecavium]